MNKHLIVIGVVIVLLAVGLSGCVDNPFQSEEDKLLGTWKATIDDVTATMIFFSDGTIPISAMAEQQKRN